MFIKILLVLLTYNVIASNCANILFVTPIPSPSHHVLHRALAVGLVNKGHNVTILTHETEKSEPPKNLTVITMKGLYEILHKMFDYSKFGSAGITETIKIFCDVCLAATEFDHTTEGFQHLWNYPKDFKFDLIIYDSSIGRYMYMFTERFNHPPSIALIPFLLPSSLSVSFGSYPITAYDPYAYSAFSDNMNLIERIYNIYYTYFDVFYNVYVLQPAEDAAVAKYYPKMKSTLGELEKKVSLILCNTDPVMDYPKILPPNIITVGGLHARPSLPLPKDLKEIMDSAKSGVIMFSLGTNIRSDQLGPTVIKSLLSAFSKLKQTVLWKFESELDGVPKNVIIRKWLPQNDIMGHPNTKLFINHGGALSTQEAVYHGLPLITIPFVADQHANGIKITSKKIGIVIDLRKLNEEVISEAINEILTTDKYSKNMKMLSAKFHDQPQSALEKAIFWTEYIIKHGDADHLSVPTRHIPFYKAVHLDILAVFFGGLVLISFTTIYFIRAKFCSKQNKEKLKAN